MTTLYNLPNDLFPDAEGDVFIHNYRSVNNTVNSKVIFRRNMINLLVSGEKIIHAATEITRVADDRFLLLSAGNCLTTEKISRQGHFSSFLVFFSNEALTRFQLKYADLISRVAATEKTATRPFLVFEKDAFINNYITSLSLVFKEGIQVSAEMQSLKFEELLLHLVEHYPGALLLFRSMQKNGMEDFEIRKAVETNIARHITVEELAFLCNTSLSTFKRRFTKIYGTSPNKWILQRRMEMAAHLLQYHNAKPSEVYHQVGYENLSSFIQSFKQTFGLTPRAFQLQKMDVLQ